MSERDVVLKLHEDGYISIMMLVLWIFIFLPFVEAQSCTSVPDSLDGTWTSTNFGTIIISSSQRTLSMTKTFGSQTAGANYFTCEFNSGTQYVFKSNDTVFAFGGSRIIYACFDFRQSSQYVYYYYLNSDPEAGLEGFRLKGFNTAVTSLSQVCETTLDAAEFNTMVKTGSENQAIEADNCPTPLLSSSIFTYTDNVGSYCVGDNATISSCSDPKYHTMYVNSSTCATAPIRPFLFSANGSLGCLLSFEGSSTTYVSFYNKDTSISTAISYQFICAVFTQVTNNTIYMSIFPTDCISGQTPTVLPSSSVGSTTTYGATLELTPTETCLPPTESTSRSWTWLIVLLPLLAAVILFVILILCLHKRCKMCETTRAREKPILVGDDHPLGEMSIALDAPPSLERVPNGYIDLETDDEFRTPRSHRKKGDTLNPIGETSLNLNFTGKQWGSLTPRKSIISLAKTDPFTEMDSGVVSLSQERSKTPKRLKTPSKQKSFLLNEVKKPRTPRPKTKESGREPLAITDGRDPYPLVTSPDRWESKTIRSEKSIKSFLARSVYAPSVMGASVKAPSIRAPSVKATSVKAPSVKALSVKAPSIKAAPSVKAGSVKAKSVKAPNTKGNAGDDKALVLRPKPKLARSFTSTKIGSVTRRSAAPPSPRKKSLNRSKTMGVQPEDSNKNGMADFMNAEMSNWGDSSEIGRSVVSKRSARTAKSRASRATNISSKTARKPIQPKMTGIPNYFRAVSIV